MKRGVTGNSGENNISHKITCDQCEARFLLRKCGKKIAEIIKQKNYINSPTLFEVDQ